MNEKTTTERQTVSSTMLQKVLDGRFHDPRASLHASRGAGSAPARSGLWRCHYPPSACTALHPRATHIRGTGAVEPTI
jgi:hypothetical protein